jgi:dihydroorotate dehydrogenase
MGLYRSVVRPVAFVFPPEAAHRAMGFLLRLPLPWASIAGARVLPEVATDLAGLPLRSPVGLAAGFDKNGRSLRGLARYGFGYLVVGTVTRSPRAGNRRPRIVRRVDTGSMVNAMGLPNRGAAAVAERLRRRPAPARGIPVLASVADEALDDVLACHAAVAPFVDGIELNASCPNVAWGRDADDETHLRGLVSRLVEERRRGGLPGPLFVKLPPFGDGPDRDAVLALARVAVDAGASGLTCSNTRPVEEPRIAVGRGGLSGRDLFERTPAIVEAVTRATGGGVTINACGGIASADDARRCLEAGATTVQLYTAMVFQGPGVVADIVRGIAAAPVDHREERARPA